MKTFVIGDIHGGLRALQAVMAKANPQSGDRLIFLGDYVDGWSQACELITYLMELKKRYTCVFIKGNHDVWCEEWLRNGTENQVWWFHGGRYTIESYVLNHKERDSEHLAFFERMPSYFMDEKNNLFVHAGFTSMHGPEKETYSTNYSWDRTLWETARALNPSIPVDSSLYPQRLKRFNKIFIGHTPTTHYGSELPMKGGNLWNVDTGAAFRGPLTMMDVETEEYWQSDPVFTYYPGERGRNED